MVISHYGTRVQDETVISLNVPDVVMNCMESLRLMTQQMTQKLQVNDDWITWMVPTATRQMTLLLVNKSLVQSVEQELFTSQRNLTQASTLFIRTQQHSRFENGEIINFADSGVSAIAANIDVGTQ